MRLKLITTKKTHKYTEGVIFDLDTNEKICDTLEDTIRDINDNGVFDNGEEKQYGETAINIEILRYGDTVINGCDIDMKANTSTEWSLGYDVDAVNSGDITTVSFEVDGNISTY